jgi:hypothetical protein
MHLLSRLLLRAVRKKEAKGSPHKELGRERGWGDKWFASLGFPPDEFVKAVPGI